MIDIATTCPHCGTRADTQSGVDNGPPRPGDMAMCWNCRRLSVYQTTPAGLMLRLPTRQEAQRALQDHELRAFLDAVGDAAEVVEATERVNAAKRAAADGASLPPGRTPDRRRRT